jgi:hypothetical protein
MSTSFAVRMEIATPISLRGLLHLDGLLGALLTARGGRLEDIPLHRHHGAWQGSAAILETGPFGPVRHANTRIRHVAAEHVPGGVFDHLKPHQRRIGEMHPMRGVLTPYPCLDGVRAVWFAAMGDCAAVLDLLSDVRNLGAMGRTGWGKVVGMAEFKTRDDSLTGLAFASGLPARTLPVTTWEQLGMKRPEAAVVSLQRPVPPYWAGEEVACVSPLQVDLMGSSAEIKAMVGEIDDADAPPCCSDVLVASDTGGPKS